MYYNVKLDSYDSLNSAGWRVATIPIITHSTHNRDRFSIPSRDGELLGADMWLSNAFITVAFHTRIGDTNWNSNFQADTMDMRYNRLMSLLKGKHNLHIKTRNQLNSANWDDAGYYEILDYVISNETRIKDDYIRVEVKFEVYPYKFIEMQSPLITDLTIVNNYDDCMPIFLVGGTEGQNVSFAVNGYELTAKCPNHTAWVYVDTRLQMAYYAEDNSGYLHDKVEMPATGDFTKLRFKADSTNVITKGTNCRYVYTYPKWGYKI